MLNAEMDTGCSTQKHSCTPTQTKTTQKTTTHPPCCNCRHKVHRSPRRKPAHFRPATQKPQRRAGLSLHIPGNVAQPPKSSPAPHMPLSISSTKRVFLYQKEDGSSLLNSSLLSALKYRSGATSDCWGPRMCRSPTTPDQSR